MKLEKIISGGQTGVDIAALMAARRMGFSTGGFIPKGWKTEAGSQPFLAKFGLVETPSSDYQTRTRLNVLRADATLLVAKDWLSVGTQLTQSLIAAAKKPSLEIDFSPSVDVDVLASSICKWLEDVTCGTLNIGGNRESKAPGIQKWSFFLFIRALELMKRELDKRDSE